MANVFLCHRKPDAPLVIRLANDLRDCGHEVWLDEWEIGTRDSIVSKIDLGLTEANYLVLCYSSSPSTDWTKREWHSTLHRQLTGYNVKILPVRISGGTPPAILADIRYADFVSDWEVALAELKGSIK